MLLSVTAMCDLTLNLRVDLRVTLRVLQVTHLIYFQSLLWLLQPMYR